MLLLQAATAPPPGWTSADLAASARIALVVFGLPLLIFSILAVLVERRYGPRRLSHLWVASLLLLVGGVAVRSLSSPQLHARLAQTGGLMPVFATGGSYYAICFGFAALAAWRLGRAGRRVRAPLLQTAGALGAALLGAPIGVAIGVAMQGLLW
jgi:hypothetical protein